MREIVNRKLAKSRKDLEDISEATDISVLRVTRQSGINQSFANVLLCCFLHLHLLIHSAWLISIFMYVVDNIKRMYSYLEEDKQFKGNLIKFVETNFLLSRNLCRRYACLLFFLYSKFNITSKKRLLKLSCFAVENSCALIIAFMLPDSMQFNRVSSLSLFIV